MVFYWTLMPAAFSLPYGWEGKDSIQVFGTFARTRAQASPVLVEFRTIVNELIRGETYRQDQMRMKMIITKAE